MLSLLQSPRQKQLLQILQSNQPLTIRELSGRMEISDSTLRRELRPFLEAGVIVSQSGRLSLGLTAESENPFILRATVNEDEKRRIARCALELVKNGETIFIAGGTTTLEFARLLPDGRRLTVITNSLLVANALAGNRNIRLVVLGGELRPDEYTLHGHLTLQALEQVRADKLFYGIEALSVEHGLTHSQLLEISTDRALIGACTQTIVLSDHTKFGKVASGVVVPLSEIQVVVTGRELRSEYREELRRLNIQLILA